MGQFYLSLCHPPSSSFMEGADLIKLFYFFKLLQQSMCGLLLKANVNTFLVKRNPLKHFECLIYSLIILYMSVTL